MTACSIPYKSMVVCGIYRMFSIVCIFIQQKTNQLMENIVLVAGHEKHPKSALMRQFLADEMKKGAKCIYISTADFPEAIEKSLEQTHNIQLGGHNTSIIDCYSHCAGLAKKNTGTIKRTAGPADLRGINAAFNDAVRKFRNDSFVVIDSLTPIIKKAGPLVARKFVQLTALKIKAAGAKGFFVVDNNHITDYADMLGGIADSTVVFSGSSIEINSEHSVQYKYDNGRIIFEGDV